MRNENRYVGTMKNELYVIKVVNQDMREPITIKGIVAEDGSPDGVSREVQKTERLKGHSYTNHTKVGITEVWNRIIRKNRLARCNFGAMILFASLGSGLIARVARGCGFIYRKILNDRHATFPTAHSLL